MSNSTSTSSTGSNSSSTCSSMTTTSQHAAPATDSISLPPVVAVKFFIPHAGGTGDMSTAREASLPLCIDGSGNLVKTLGYQKVSQPNLTDKLGSCLLQRYNIGAKMANVIIGLTPPNTRNLHVAVNRLVFKIVKKILADEDLAITKNPGEFANILDTPIASVLLEYCESGNLEDRMMKMRRGEAVIQYSLDRPLSADIFTLPFRLSKTNCLHPFVAEISPQNHQHP
eukprot:GHVQ01040629.1.p1 GENE.GHVQ01040629.1~~GHVQ01040629.1.p1  ORF type:complete len:248 (-),score=50.95 GHVQ01040629.1:429-1109(-)